ncbi:hypothetical protein N7603_08320 [Acholeplasma vituli]|uniref:Uncharacterized protein n=1 Tax=Paracholeplasma vituli TaxID=69473 RepID=A0ABT2Q0Y7_9MOLU|nr:hypothetical protein [Paracholeplasma vituli]MCU0105662.1 hypothetical protein [Paracholeplasma vituli]
MRLIKVDQDNIFIDGDFIEIEDVTAELLEDIVAHAMNDQVVFDIHPGNRHPLATFLRIVEKDAQPDSPFRKNYHQVNQK